VRKKITLLFAILFALTSCKKTLDRSPLGSLPPDGFKEFVIEAGSHYASENGYKQISKTKEIRFMAWLDSSCIYTSVDPVNQGDINKLYGFGDCNSGHQESSARFGWNWNGNAFEIHAYCYVNGARKSKLLGSLRPREKAEMQIAVTPNQYIFKFNGKSEAMDRGCTSEEIDGYQLYPYFGGDEVAPHRMSIYIKEL
jgi:hypothetical protein